MRVILLEVFASPLFQFGNLGLCFLLVVRQLLHGELLVEEVGRDVVQIDELNSRFGHHLTIPLAIRAIAPLNLSARPFVARCERDQDGRCPLLATVVDHLPQIPTERVDQLVGVVGQMIDVAGVLRRGNHATCLLVVDGTDVVMAELDGDEVARLQRVVDLVPQSLADERACAAARLGCIAQRDFRLVEHGESLRRPAPHAIILAVGILHR